jgi:hypothetical protein
MNSTPSAAATSRSETNSAFSPSPNYFALGAELLGQVQRILGRSHVRGLRVKMGSRVIKEVPVGPMSAALTAGIVLLAVVVSTMSIEVEHEPARGAASEAAL